MTTATKYVTVKATAPDGRGSFQGVVDANPPGGDSDGERINSWANLPTETPLSFMHLVQLGDPAAIVGKAQVLLKSDNRRLLVLGQLDLASKLAQAVHERLLLPDSDPNALAELSVGFHFDSTKAWKDSRNVRVIEDATLIELSIVRRGAQPTSISNVKNESRNELDAATARLLNTLDILEAELHLKQVTSPAIPNLGDEDPVDAFIREDRTERAREAAEAKRLEEVGRSLSLLPNELVPSECDRTLADAERFARDRDLIAARDRENVAEAEARWRADEARREAARRDPRVYSH